MTTREHERAVRLALQTDAELRRLFDRLGNREHPRGRVLSAYRQARRALKGNVGNLAIVREVLVELRQTLASITYEALVTASRVGTVQAQRTLDLYDLGPAMVLPDQSGGLAAWQSAIDSQVATVLALAAMGEEAAILGDGERVGALSPAPVTSEGARWLAVAALASLSGSIDEALRRQRREDFMRQAVAAIDERTTDCCLQVHGQVVGMSERFRLTGTPRFADRVMAPPFHWYCRSSVALVRRADADDDLSVAMREAAAAERQAREETGRRRMIHPSHATSRR